MTLPRTALLPAAKTSSPPLELVHRLLPVANVQRRLAGRIALLPDVDLGAWQFQAVVDWVEFRLCLARPTQAQHVQQVLRRFLDRDSHIQPEDKQAGSVFSICRIRVQEPRDLALIHELHQALTDRFGEVSESRVTGLEVSIDLYPEAPSDTTRATLLGALQRTIWTDRDIWTNPNSRPRFVFGKREDEKPPKVWKLSPSPEMDHTGACRSIPDNHTRPAIDATMYLGAKTDDVMIRLRDKIIDRQQVNGQHIGLGKNEKRVRIEVTLKGAELEGIRITNTASLRHLKLSRFQRLFFSFRLPTFEYYLTPRSPREEMLNRAQKWDAETYLRSGITGMNARRIVQDAKRKRWRRDLQKRLRAQNPGQKRSWKGTRLAEPFIAWREMNQRVSEALVRLDKREATAWKKVSKGKRLSG